MFIYIIIFVVFSIIIITLIEKHKQVTIDNLIIKISEATKEIDILLQKKIELLTKLSKIINKTTDKKILSDISKIKNKKLNMFELEEQLYVIKNEFDNYAEENNLILDEDNQILISKLERNDLELKALKLYYNKETNIYNVYIKKITYLLTRIRKKYKKKDLFNIKKEVEFEILKNDNR